MLYRTVISLLGIALLFSQGSLKRIAAIDLPGAKGQRFDYLTVDDEDRYLLSAHLGPGIEINCPLAVGLKPASPTCIYRIKDCANCSQRGLNSVMNCSYSGLP
jgi:hypothetical protein